MSRQLGRLRELFGDPLFVRTPRGMVPTARADWLLPRVVAVLDAEGALFSPETFDPAALTRGFVLATSGFLDVELVPRLVARLARAAPGASLTTRPIGHDTTDQLAAGQVDVVVGVRGTLPLDARRVRLYDDPYVSAVREGHPMVGDTLSLEQFLALGHVIVAPTGGPGGPVDTALTTMGLTRRVVVRVHAFPAAPAVVAATDLVLTAASRVLTPVARGLRLFPPPVALKPVTVFLGWHPRAHADPAHAWFRQLVVEASADGASGRPTVANWTP